MLAVICRGPPLCTFATLLVRKVCNNDSTCDVRRDAVAAVCHAHVTTIAMRNFAARAARERGYRENDRYDREWLQFWLIDIARRQRT